MIVTHSKISVGLGISKSNNDKLGSQNARMKRQNVHTDNISERIPREIENAFCK